MAVNRLIGTLVGGGHFQPLPQPLERPDILVQEETELVYKVVTVEVSGIRVPTTAVEFVGRTLTPRGSGGPPLGE